MKLINKLIVLTFSVVAIFVSAIIAEPEEGSVFLSSWDEMYQTGISFAYINGEFVPANDGFPNHIILGYKLISNSISVKDNCLDVKTKSLFSGDTIHYYCRLISIKYSDYAKQDSLKPGNNFNGLYYCQKKKFAYALDCEKGRIVIYWRDSQVKEECSIVFHQNYPGFVHPVIEIVEKKWFLTYNGISPNPMSGIYEIEFEIEDNEVTQAVSVDLKKIDDATMLIEKSNTAKSFERNNLLTFSNGYINYNLSEKENVILSVFNIQGKKLFSYKREKNPGRHYFSVKSNLPSGKYVGILQTKKSRKRIFFNLVD